MRSEAASTRRSPCSSNRSLTLPDPMCLIPIFRSPLFSSERLQALEDHVCVLNVARVVEASLDFRRIKVLSDLGIGLEKLEEAALFVPCSGGVALHQLVCALAGQRLLEQRPQNAL